MGDQGVLKHPLVGDTVVNDEVRVNETNGESQRKFNFVMRVLKIGIFGSVNLVCDWVGMKICNDEMQNDRYFEISKLRLLIFEFNFSFFINHLNTQNIDNF